MLKFLSQQSHKLLDDFLPLVIDMTNNRIVNYLSFYLSHTGKHLYHYPKLLSHKVLTNIFSKQLKENVIFKQQDYSVEQLLAQHLLSIHFHQHVVDQKTSLRMYRGLMNLPLINKQDILEQFLRNKCEISGTGTVQVKQEISHQERRNIYIQHNQTMPAHSQLEQILIRNPLHRVPNLNKILVFKQNPTMNLHLPPHLETFCHQHSIKLKLLPQNNLSAILQYIYQKTKRNILIHQTVNHDHSIYNLQTTEQKLRKVDGKIINPMNQKIMPREVIVLSQRLPKESVVRREGTNKNIVMFGMKKILSRQGQKELIDPEIGLTFDLVEKNYRFQDIEGQSYQTLHNFSSRRFVSHSIYKLNRRPDVIPHNPFALPK